jgi:acetyl-CoA acyltransferase
VAVAGGTESMSMVPMGGNKVAPNPWLMDHYPDAYISMGLTAENVAKKYGITREQADEFSSRAIRRRWPRSPRANSRMRSCRWR